jgi:sugar phosphate isomerase/epimerase
MKYSGRTQMLSDRYSVFEAIDFFSKAGFDGVELCYEDLLFRVKTDLWEPRIIGLIRKKKKKSGIAISAVGNHLKYFYDDFMFEAVKKGIRSTRKYGADVFIFAGMNDANEKVGHKELRPLAVKRIAELCKLAESEGVKLAMEPEPPSIFANTRDFLELCGEIGSPALGVNFDVGHAFLTDPDILESIDMLRGKIYHGHIEDMQRGQHLHLLPGDGDMDLRAVINKLEETGFTGYMSIDLYNYNYREASAEALARLREYI